MKLPRYLYLKTLLGLALTLSMPSLSLLQAQVLLSDDFNTGSQVNPLEWRVPFGGDSSFLGQTQLKTDNGLLPSIVNGAAVLELDTFLDGAAFSGHEMITKRNFALGGGLVWKARMKLNSTTPNGVVGGGFLFDVVGEDPPGTFIRDEIDVELLSNEANGDNRVLTNTWDDENFTTGEGDAAFVPGSVPPASPYDLNAYHDYEMRWTPGKVEWAIDNTVVRTVTGEEVPNDPMSARFNIWVPDSGFTSAFDPTLVPAASVGNNATYTMEVDSVSIERINTSTGANLLANGSFENGDFTDDFFDWEQFGNASADSAQVLAQDGLTSMKTFGPFTGSSDATGAFQTVTGIEAGKEYSASVFAFNPSSMIDSLVGTNNFAEIKLEFQDTAGNTLSEASTPIYDGRDPLLSTAGVQDNFNEFVVEGLAPEGTTQAVVSLFFIQIIDDNGGPDGGAVWFDNAQLVELIPDVSFDPADFDEDGDVDAADLATWEAAFGSTAAGDTNGDGDSDGADFLAWQRQFTGPGTSTVAAVPEPSGVLLALVGGCLLAKLRRKNLLS